MKDIPCSWIKRRDIVKKTILSKLIYRYDGIKSKFPASALQKFNIKFQMYMEIQNLIISKRALTKKKIIGPTI